MKPQTLNDALRAMTPEQRVRFAKLAKTTPGALRQIAIGKRGASALMAVNIDRAAARMGLRIPREGLNSGCAVCEYARTCSKKEIAR